MSPVTNYFFSSFVLTGRNNGRCLGGRVFSGCLPDSIPGRVFHSLDDNAGRVREGNDREPAQPGLFDIGLR